MKVYFLILIGTAMLLAGCSNDSPSPEGPPAQNTSAPVNQATAEGRPPAGPLGPSDTLRALSDASNRQDVEGIKRYLSSGTLKRLQEGAKEQNMTVDEALKDEEGAPFLILPELGQERIAGDTATVDVRNIDTGEFEKLPFVKENGEWKVAIDKYFDDLETAEQKPEAKKP